MQPIITVAYVFMGVFVGALFCTIPSLHIYNVAGIALVLWLAVRDLIPYYALAPFFMSMVVAFSFINTIPMTFLGAVDESAGVSMLPSNAMVTRGKGKDAALLQGLGTLAGALLLALFTPFFYFIWPYVTEILGPHLHWLLGVIMVFYVMSEWPKGAGRGETAWQKFKDGWRNLFPGLLTFTLSGIFGLIFISKSIIPIDMAFQNIMPVFVGFFAFPSIIQSLISDFKIDKQYDPDYINADWIDVAYGSGVGVVGGLMAAYMPAVTAGIGALFGGHVTNHRNLDRAEMNEVKDNPNLMVDIKTPELYYRQERNFLISGGVGKIFYYVGAFLFLFVLTDLTPHGMGRGGLNFILKPVFSPEPGDYWVMISAIILSASLSYLLLEGLTKWFLHNVQRLPVKLIYTFALLFVSSLIFYLTGWQGVMVTAITTCIGCIPVFFNCRRSHCMAVLLVPIALNMAGYGDVITQMLGLI